MKIFNEKNNLNFSTINLLKRDFDLNPKLLKLNLENSLDETGNSLTTDEENQTRHLMQPIQTQKLLISENNMDSANELHLLGDDNVVLSVRKHRENYIVDVKTQRYKSPVTPNPTERRHHNAGNTKVRSGNNIRPSIHIYFQFRGSSFLRDILSKIYHISQTHIG
jgi:hypothetical protein